MVRQRGQMAVQASGRRVAGSAEGLGEATQATVRVADARARVASCDRSWSTTGVALAEAPQLRVRPLPSFAEISPCAAYSLSLELAH